MITVFLPRLVPSTNMNSRLHWARKSRIARQERSTATVALFRKPRPTLPIVVTLTRCSTGWPDSDQAVTSMKHVRDGVADWLGIDDGDDRITWNVERRRVKRAETGTEIRIEARAERRTA